MVRTYFWPNLFSASKKQISRKNVLVITIVNYMYLSFSGTSSPLIPPWKKFLEISFQCFFFDLTILRMGSLQCTQIWDQLRVYNKNHFLLTCLRQQIKIWFSLKDKAYQRKFTSRFYHHDYSNTIIDFIIKYFVNIRFAFNLHTNIHNVKHDITKMKCQWLKFSFKTEFHLNWHFSFKIQTNTNNHLFRIISYTTLHLKKKTNI